MRKTLVCSALLTLFVAALLGGPAEAETIYLQDGWHASVTNVRFLVGNPGAGHPLEWVDSPFGYGMWQFWQNSPHITVQTQAYADWANFNMTTGSVVLGQEYAYLQSMYALSEWYHGIQFDWTTNWTGAHAAEHLRFEVWGQQTEQPEPQYMMCDYFYPGAGLRSGHAVMSSEWYTRGAGFLELRLVASPIPVPEPSALVALASGLAGLGGVFFKRRRR